MKFLFSLLLFLPLSLTHVQAADPAAEATYRDIKETLGSVPTFLKRFPESAITGAWQDMKGTQLSTSTVIPGKYKELIGLAVSAQVPCRYCIYFHGQAAKLNKATDKEMGEAIALASMNRRMSTFLSGTQVNLDSFKKEVDSMLKFTASKRNMQAMEEKPTTVAKAEVPMVMTSQEAYTDIKNTFGFMPEFMKGYPESSIAGLWQEMKGIEFNPQSAIPGKYKNLIGVAVGAQIPCPYCVYFHTQSAITQGASPEEINEAVAMAGITREWSTVLNGQYTDEKKFREETDVIMKFLKNKMSKTVGLNL
jgi:AhpD family alkylhydroperoxidase